MKTTPPKPLINKEVLRSYGRVNGRKLTQSQMDLVQNFLPEVAIDLDNLAPVLNQEKAINLEIGFGTGEHLASIAKQYPDQHFIGCEMFTNGMALLLRQIREEEISNISIFHGDARLLLDKLPEASLSRVFILFPDPWPKIKHHKKRLINNELLKKLSKSIKENGKLDIATDHANYAQWIDNYLKEFSHIFTEDNSKTRETPPPDWTQTKYQRKAKLEGRTSVFFNYIKSA